MSIDREAAQKIITPDVAKPLFEAIHLAYSDWDKHVTPEARATTSFTTKSSFINDRMIFHAKDKLQAFPKKVAFKTRNGRTHLVIDGTVEIKLKKLNRNLRPANIQTATVIDYHNQVVQLPTQPRLFDSPIALANLIAGYQETRVRTGVEAVCIVHPKGENNIWQWRLDFDAMPVSLTIFKAPPTTEPPQGKKVTPKKVTRPPMGLGISS